jgi:Lhr-like helicase
MRIGQDISQQELEVLIINEKWSLLHKTLEQLFQDNIDFTEIEYMIQRMNDNKINIDDILNRHNENPDRSFALTLKY